MTRRIFTTALSLIVAGTAAACADGATERDPAPADPEGVDVARSALERDDAADVTAGELDELIVGHTAFSFDLYHQLSGDAGNVVCSPHSVAVALAMTWAGARGDTAAQMADALHFSQEPERLHASFNALDLALSSRGEGAMGQDGEPFRLRVVNAAWAERTYTFMSSFLDTLALNYGAGVYLLDFLGATEASRAAINEWVSAQTEARIPELLPEGGVTPDTRLVLTNAVYFNASWKTPFEPHATEDAPFHRLAGGAVDVPTMSSTVPARHAEGEGWVAVELPYDGDEVAMLLATTTDDADFRAFEEGLGVAWLSEVDAALTPGRVDLRLPRFEYRAAEGLVPSLRGLGMVDAFDASAADLSGIDGTRDLFVSDVLHEAFISLDEAGTEAAAATAVVVGVTSVPPPPVPVSFDRPFVYLIRDVATGATLFIGRVEDPSAG